MTSYQPPLDEIRFVLRHHADLEGLARLPGLEAASPDLVDQVLAEAGRFAANELAPLNAPGDRQRARLTEDGVRTPDGSKEAYRKFVDGGWHGLQVPAAGGGPGRPWTVATAVW
jgi:alkylation response protein AidB-like acyl-CoA dehydrogenase